MSFECEPEGYRSLMERYGLPVDVIDGVLCMHAHELAEKIRAAGPPVCDGFAGDCLCGCEAADLIDPEVSSNG